MSLERNKNEQESVHEKKTRKRWQRFLGAAYRLVIIVGLILLLIGSGLVLFTDIIPYWVLFLPLSLILIGIILARVEYALHKSIKYQA